MTDKNRQKVESCTAAYNGSCDRPAYGDSKICVIHSIDTSYGDVDTYTLINILDNLHGRIIDLETSPTRFRLPSSTSPVTRRFLSLLKAISSIILRVYKWALAAWRRLSP